MKKILNLFLIGAMLVSLALGFGACSTEETAEPGMTVKYIGGQYVGVVAEPLAFVDAVVAEFGFQKIADDHVAVSSQDLFLCLKHNTVRDGNKARFLSVQRNQELL